MKQIEKYLENECETKKTEIIYKCFISVDREIIMRYAQNNQQNRKDEIKFG